MTPWVDLELPDGDWLAIPVGADAQAWATGTAALLCEGLTGAQEPLVAELELLARKATEHQAIAAAALLAGSTTSYVLASLLIHEVTCGTSCATVGAELTESGVRDLVPPTVETVDLPAGQAVRVRTVMADERGPVVESVDHVLPLGDGTGVRLQLSWLSIALGEQLGGLADACAQALSVQV